MSERQYKSLRLWEFVTCAICFGLAVSTFVNTLPLNEFIKAILLIASFSYLFLTAVDIIMLTASKSIFWMPWLPLAIAASLLYFLCTGVLIFAKPYIQSVVYEIIVMAYLAGGILFLADALILIHMHFLVLEENINISVARRSGSFRSFSETERLNKSVQVQIEFEHNLSREESLLVEPEIIRIPIRDHVSIKKTNSPGVSSHGGTFHVSKSVVPISTLPTQNFGNKPQEIVGICDCGPVKVRSIAIGVKPIGKHTEDIMQSTKSKIIYSTLSDEEEPEVITHFDNFDVARYNAENILRNVDNLEERPSEKSKHYMVYHCTTTMGSDQSTRESTPDSPIPKYLEPIFVDPSLLPALEEEIGTVKQYRNETKRKFERHIGIESFDNEALESENYKKKLYDFTHPVKSNNLSPRSRFDLEGESSLYACKQNASLIPQPTILPGTVETMQDTAMVNTRKHTTLNESMSYEKKNLYPESKRPQSSRPSTSHSADEAKK